MGFTKTQIEKIWNKGGSAEDDYHCYEMKDDSNCPAKLYKTERNDSNMAWEIDHIFPKAILQERGVPEDLIDHEDNLRPLQHSNNESKGTHFPTYTKVRSWNGMVNDVCEIEVTIPDEIIDKLENLYAKYLNGQTLTEIAAEYNERHKEKQ